MSSKEKRRAVGRIVEGCIGYWGVMAKYRGEYLLVEESIGYTVGSIGQQRGVLARYRGKHWLYRGEWA